MAAPSAMTVSSLLTILSLLAAPVAGLESIGLEWEDLSCSLEKGGASRLLLDGVSGAARRGAVTAIMGPSGSGKTLLLNSLCGQVRATSGLQLEGTLRVNGREASPADLQLAYVKQEDSFYSEMTVRETLRFHAKLRMPKNATEAEVEGKLERLLGLLGLRKSADTPVGSVASRGISGGERKRLSIACELISDPPLVFLDEPLSGLDSFQAANVMGRLRRLADAGHTVVLTLHQPSISIFRLVDELVVLSEGQPAYCGPAGQLGRWAAANGHPRPGDVPQTEHFLDVVSVDYQSAEAERASRERIAAFAAATRAAHARRGAAALPSLSSSLLAGLPLLGRFAPAAPPAPPAPAPRAAPSTRPISGPWTQFRLLLGRAWRQVSRAKGVLLIKAVQQVMIALIYGGIYKLDLSQRSVQDRLGLLSLIAVGASNLAIAGTIRAFPKEKVLVYEERGKRLYSVVTYFASKLIADVPLSAALSLLFGGLVYPLVGLQRTVAKFAQFLGLVILESLASSALGLLLGSIAPSTDAALAMFPPIVVLMVIFNGFNINPESVPAALRWVPSLSLIRWAFEGMAVNEFSGLKFEPPVSQLARASGAFTPTGERALENLSFGKSSVRRCALAQGCIIAGCWAGSLRSLQKNRPRMAAMRPPSSAAAANSKGRRRQ